MKKRKKLNDFIIEIKKNLPLIDIKKNEKLSSHTTFKIGGKCSAFVEVKRDYELIILLRLAKEYNIKYFILGLGSNTLFSDKNLDYLVIKNSISFVKIKGNKIVCGAGLPLAKLNLLAQKNALSGVEWCLGIPGSVGGAVKMNAGCFGFSMQNVVSKVYFTDGNKIYFKHNKNCDFSYRHSMFLDKNFVILKVEFSLLKDEKKIVEERSLKYFKTKIESQPYGEFSAGSVFRKTDFVATPILLEALHFKGKKCGCAQVSKKHCGFIVNNGGRAKFSDVMKLILKIKKKVFKKYDIMLQEEIIILKS